MCSWFCETFCCFLVRFRDSYIQNTAEPVDHRNRGHEANPRNRPQNVRDPEELSTLPYNSTGENYIADLQPPSRSPIPQYQSLIDHNRGEPLPILGDTLDGGGETSRLGRRLGEHPTSNISSPRLRGSSNLGVGYTTREDQAGDISLVSVRSPKPSYVLDFILYVETQTMSSTVCTSS